LNDAFIDINIAAFAQHWSCWQICWVLRCWGVTTVNCRQSDNRKHGTGLWSNCRILSHWQTQHQLLTTDWYDVVKYNKQFHNRLSLSVDTDVLFHFVTLGLKWRAGH